MAAVRKEEVRTQKFHLELDSLEASVLLAILDQSVYAFETASDIAEALGNAGVKAFGDSSDLIAPFRP